MQILLVDNHDSFTYNLVDLIQQKIGCNVTVIKSEAIQIEDVATFTHIIFSPGPGIPSEQPAMFEILKKYGHSKKILGICLGMQAIGEYYGAKLYNLPEVIHGQQQDLHLVEKNLLFDQLNSPIKVGLYHSWALDKELPKSIRLIAVSQNDIVQSIKHDTYNIYGVQFHPESHLTPNGKIIIENFLNL